MHFGYANRFGAITANGKGETVLGQIMMLKNANSKEVINEVKDRVADIQNNLPEGVFINPILERSELISETSTTVAENLILGAIIVMITVFLLLGNLPICPGNYINDTPGIVLHHFDDVSVRHRCQFNEFRGTRFWNYY